MFNFKKISIFFLLIYFFFLIPNTSAKYYFSKEIQFQFEVNIPIPDEKFDEINLAVNNQENNLTNIIICAKDENSGISKIELYIDNDLYRSFEYNDIILETVEEIEIETDSIPYYSNSYVVGIDNEGNVLKSNVVIARPFRIFNISDLIEFRRLHNQNLLDFTEKSVYLMKDIDLADLENWEEIGSPINSFKGIFYGNNHRIYNLKIEANDDNKGLFSQNNGIIKDLIVNRRN